MSDIINDIKSEFSSILESCIKITGPEYEESIRSYLTTASLRIWSSNKLFSEAYVEPVKVISGKEHSKTQLITAMQCISDTKRELTVPDFFRKVVTDDVENGSENSRLLIKILSVFLSAVAAVNGDFTIEEASALRSIGITLLQYCNDEQVTGSEELEVPVMKITELKKESYYYPDGERKDVSKIKLCENEKDEIDTDKTSERESDEDLKRRLSQIDLPSMIAENKVTFKGDDDVKGAVKETAPSAEGIVTLESVIDELNSLVGLAKVKEDVQGLLNFIKICQLREQYDLKVPTMSYHLVFTGNPGTGKTTVARMIAKLYFLMGILPQGQLIETDRSGLVGGYMGQTAIKTQKVIQQAIGGVLFIDEAYSLINDEEKDSYGKEAIETILKAMEDHRDELVVIVAGYDGLMQKFIDSNPGLRSRFNKYFHFPDYNGDELLRILQRFCDSNGYVLDDNCVPMLKSRFDKMYAEREEHFGNARTIRNLFEHAINEQANRLAKDSDITRDELVQLTVEDISAAFEEV